MDTSYIYKTCGADVYEDLHFVTGKQCYTHRLARLVIEPLTEREFWLITNVGQAMQK